MSSEATATMPREAALQRDAAEHAASLSRSTSISTSSPGRRVARAQQQREQDEVRRASTSRRSETNGSVMPVSGMSRVTPPTMTKVCSAKAATRPDGGERRHVRACARRRREPAQAEDEVGDDERRGAQKPDLLADRREDEVGLHEGDAPGKPAPDADAGRAARPRARRATARAGSRGPRRRRTGRARSRRASWTWSNSE